MQLSASILKLLVDQRVRRSNEESGHRRQETNQVTVQDSDLKIVPPARPSITMKGLGTSGDCKRNNDILISRGDVILSPRVNESFALPCDEDIYCGGYGTYDDYE